MTTIVTRAGKGSPLTNNEVDQNFTNLNTDKLEASDLASYLTSSAAASTYLPLSGGTLSGNLVVNSTGAVTVSSGTTEQRPGSPVNGMFRYNSTTAQFEGYANNEWGAIAGSSGGGGGSASGVILENDSIIGANYTLTAGKNGLSVGPVTLPTGIEVTVASDQAWLILE